MWLAVTITAIVIFAICEYYNRRIIAEVKKQIPVRRHPHGRTLPRKTRTESV